DCHQDHWFHRHLSATWGASDVPWPRRRCSIAPQNQQRRKTMRRTYCAAAVVLACAAYGAARADETCNSPYISKLIKGQEDYVCALGMEGVGDGSDKLVTVDVNPKSKTYGKVINSVSTGTRAEAHHMGFADDRRHIWAGGLSENRIWVFDIAADPAKPKLVRT